MKILVVEDEPVVQTYVTAILSRAGFEAEVEANGDEALRRYRASGPYCLVLTDICHRGMDGFDLVNAIRLENQTQAIVIVTGNVDAVHVSPTSANFRQTFKDIAVLEKPFRVQQLLRVVQGRYRKSKGCARAKRLTAAMKNHRLLLVNDLEGLQEVFAAHLAETGWQIEPALDGNEALRLYRKQGSYDLVLTDIQHPGPDGIEVIKRIRKRNPSQASCSGCGMADV